MKKSLIVVFIFGSSLLFGGECLPILKGMDRSALTSSYKEIAYLAYKHRKKREYIKKSLEIIAKLREKNAEKTKDISRQIVETRNIPLAELSALEVDALSSSTKTETALFQTGIYRSIEKEIDEVFDVKKKSGKK